jgi:hypothetical protein
MRPDADEKLMLVVVEADDVDGWIRAVEWEKFGVEDQGGCRAVVLLFLSAAASGSFEAAL